MNITIIGTGYVGLVTGACLADLGNNVLCVDVDEAKICTLHAGEVPIHEPGLKEVIARNVEAGRLSFSSATELGIAHAQVLFIAVGTPPAQDGSADLQYVLEVARAVGRHMDGFKVVVTKSTVPVGTAERVRAVIEAELLARSFRAYERPGAEGFSNEAGKWLRPMFSVISNPEFLKEGAAIEDFARPDRIVLGVGEEPADRVALDLMRQLYAPFNRNHDRTLVMDVRSAEFTKYAANAMLATRISFMNELADLADRVGVDIEHVRQGIGSDPRIGYSFLYAGAGYGGSCFPKDLKSLCVTARSQGRTLRILDAVESVNRDQKGLLAHRVLERYGSDLQGKRFAVWGLAFKPNTDDMREAPSRVVIAMLVRAGASLYVHDPVAAAQARSALEHDLSATPELLHNIHFVDKHMDALRDADGLIVVTEWKAYRSPHWAAVKAAMKTPVIFDGRNLYEPRQLQDEEIELLGIGRRNRIAATREYCERQWDLPASQAAAAATS